MLTLNADQQRYLHNCQLTEASADNECNSQSLA